MVELSQRLRQLRKEKHLTQTQVAVRVGVTASMISSYETDIRTPSPEVLLRLADLLGTTTDHLLGREERRMLDISDLTKEEAEAVSTVVEAFRKNHH